MRKFVCRHRKGSAEGSTHAVSKSSSIRVKRWTLRASCRVMWCVPGMGVPLMSDAACQRSVSQSSTLAETTADGGPRFPRTEAVAVAPAVNSTGSTGSAGKAWAAAGSSGASCSGSRSEEVNPPRSCSRSRARCCASWRAREPGRPDAGRGRVAATTTTASAASRHRAGMVVVSCREVNDRDVGGPRPFFFFLMGRTDDALMERDH